VTASTKTRKPRRTPEEYAAQRRELEDRLVAFREYLEDLDDDERVSEAVAHFAEHYSERNAALIVMQAPDATDVRGFQAWKELGRSVRKGEHGIQILAPAGRSEDGAPTEQAPEGTSGRQFFRIAYVFDYAQTDPVA
jgi:hypothetical protein